MVRQKKKFFLPIILGSFLLLGVKAHADETSLFTSMTPDALIVLDLSGSMNLTPAGGMMYINPASGACGTINGPFYPDSVSPYTSPCLIESSGTVPRYSNTSCTGPFYKNTSVSGYSTDCSRLDIAKRAIFTVLDENNSGTVDKSDESSLWIRFGYMRFFNCNADDTGGSYTSGCNSLIWPIDSRYSRIYCNSASGCSSGSSSSGSVSGESASGGTPLASALAEAKLYLDAHKAADSAGSCRQKFVILITDGADTFACGGEGREDQETQYKRRRATVARAKALADAGYRVFVVGFGALMPHWLRNTLNWAAYYGGTDNPLVGNSGNTSAYSPAGDSCQDSATASHNIEGDGVHSYATENDPGELSLSGYAFLAANATELSASLKQAIEMIREATYSFSLSSVSSQRTQDENYIYEASFQPMNRDPFWLGHLKKYQLNSDGTVGSVLWDAGEVLQATNPANRNIKTYKSGGVVNFSTTDIAKEDLGVTTDAERNAIVGYIRGESAYNPDNWKLGDIFRSNPVTIGTPSSFFTDLRDANDAFATYRSNNQRTSADGRRVIVVGANDGQFRAFLTSDGSERWSFIPPNLLMKLKNIAHSAHPTGLSHQYFVDGPISAADVWLGTGDGSNKAASDWKTMVIFGEGQGGSTSLWSSSTSCTSGFSSTYSSTFTNYCGYYAFDFTDTLNPQYRWRVNPTASQAPYLAEPWGKMAMGRVRIAGNEKWVGFVGGGYNAADCAGGGQCDSRGKGFYVIDLSNGNVLWSYTRANDTNMEYSLTAPPAVVDTDNDGLIDTVYIGGLGGSMWRFKFCSLSAASDCDTSNWSGSRLFAASTGVIRPIFTMPSVSKDQSGNLWVYWGTGDKTDPTASHAQEKFYAVKDNDRTSTYNINDLENITSSTYVDAANKKGWYINLAGQGEKILADPAVFGGVVYFTSYFPPSGGNPCNQAGQGNLYGLNHTTGAGVLLQYDAQGQPIGSPTRSLTIGIGIPTAPVISFKPVGSTTPSTPAGTSMADIYVTVSGGAGMNVSTIRVNFNPPTLANRTNILYWKDKRLE